MDCRTSRFHRSGRNKYSSSRGIRSWTKRTINTRKTISSLALLKSETTEDGIQKAAQMVEFFGLGHSAAIHTQNQELANEFGRQVKAIRVIWNSPSTFGGIGDVYNAFIPSLTLGCGSYGRNSVGGNVG